MFSHQVCSKGTKYEGGKRKKMVLASFPTHAVTIRMPCGFLMRYGSTEWMDTCTSPLLTTEWNLPWITNMDTADLQGSLPTQPDHSFIEPSIIAMI